MNQAAATLMLLDALGKQGVRYLIGGSLGSSLDGIPRSTLAIDLLVDLSPDRAESITRKLGSEWYADPEYARDSTARGQAFNVVHIPTSEKFDLFPATTEFHRSQLERARFRTLPLRGGDVEALVATAEDTILAKLKWFRQGGEVSDRQWSDITGILLITRDLDHTYLNHWAAKLGVSDLLARAMEDSPEP